MSKVYRRLWFRMVESLSYNALILEDWFRPFPSSLLHLSQSESKCETILLKMNLICLKMKLHAELIFI